MTDSHPPSDPSAAPASPRTSPPLRRRLLGYLAAVAGCAGAAWGAARYWEWKLHQPALLHYRAGSTLYSTGKPQQAVDEWQEAIRLEPSWPDPYFRLAEAMESAGQPEDALLVLQRVSRKIPKAEHVTCRIAEVYAMMQDRVGTEEWAAAAIKKEPNCARAHLAFARTHRGRLADTLEHYRKSYQLSPDDGVLLELAKVQAESGDLAGAEKTLAGPAARRPADGEVRYLQGYILSRRAHDPQTAERAAAPLRALLDADPNRYDACAELGLLYERQRDWSKARTYFLRARTLNPYSATILFHLGTVERQMGDPHAQDRWQQVHSLQDKEKRWRELRRKLLQRPGDVALMLETAELSRDLGAVRLALNLTQGVLAKDPQNEKARRLQESVLRQRAAPSR